MIIRPVQMADWRFLVEAYADWPLSDNGPITPDTVVRWIRRWTHRKGQECLIGDVDGEPVAVIIFRRAFFAAVIDNVVVHPSMRGHGHSREISRLTYNKLASEGVVAAEFEAIPGPIADLVGSVFERVGDGVGPHTGLPVVRGRITEETEL